MPKITKSLVDRKGAGDSRYYIWDETCPGFGLVVQPSGTKSYCFQYRTQEGQSRRITIGKHGAYTPEEARKKAREYQRQVSDGKDPLAIKEFNKNAVTVSHLLDLYLESPKFAEKSELTQRYDKGRIERHLKPLLGRKVAEKLTADDVRKASKDIETGKTAKTVKTGPRGLARVTGGPGAARMAIRLLKSAFSWAFEHDLIETNTPAKVKVGEDAKRDLRLTNEEYARLFSVLDEMESTAKIRQPVADTIRVIALTGARRNEIAGLRWRHVNLEKGVIELPLNEHKTGMRTGEIRVIGLPNLAQQIITQQEKRKPNDFVFPPARGSGPLNISKPWRKIRVAAGLNPKNGLHALRHSLASIMADSGSQATHIMAVMGHKNLATSQRYIHMAEDRRSELAEAAAAGISAAMNVKNPPNK